MATTVIPIFQVGDYEAQISRGAQALRDGGVVVLPTETAYGAAALLSNPRGRERLTLFRGASDRPFIPHLAQPREADAYLGDVGDYGRRLIRKLWPGPVALVFNVPAERRAEAAAKLNVAESDIYDSTGAVTLRCPKHVVFSDVAAGAGGPVALTLAGSGTSGAGFSATALSNELGDRADLIYDAGPTDYSKPSTILKVGKDRYEIVRAGVFDERIIDRLLRTTILFVCSGNTCRSPMAEAIARKVIAAKLGIRETELENRGLSVLSAGSYAMPGARATPQAVEAVRLLGADLSSHRSRPLSVELVHQADMIYTMTRGHASAVLALSPSASDKTATLDPQGDIEDPIGGGSQLYQNLAAQLQVLIEKRLGEKPIA